MPHLIAEYSENLSDWVDVDALLRGLHRAADATGLFQPATIRTRGIPCAHYVVGEGTARDAFIHLQARIRPGRADAAQWHLAETLMAQLKTAVAPAQEGGIRVGLTAEVTLIPPVRVLYSTLGPGGTVMEFTAPPLTG